MRLLLLIAFAFQLAGTCEAANPPNVLFIAVDDLNHWLTHLGRNPQARTPNFDRLAARGVTFTNAHCAVPACEPSRLALMSGRRPWTTGCYRNGDLWKQHQASGEGLSAQFLKAGYHVAGAGKIYHSMQFYPGEWSHYLTKRGVKLDGPKVEKLDGYFNDVVHPDLKDDDLYDWHTVNDCIDQLGLDRQEPFFIACGLYKPHLPFVVPRKYYEAFPLESIELPPHIEDDLDDVPPAGVRMAGPGRDHATMLKTGRWKAAIQSYLATCAYTDMNLGRLLDALDQHPQRDNTIVCLWSDHGWSFGEKQHWRKFALWEEATRTPMIWVVPGVTDPGTRCDRSVDLMSVYPTLCDLADLPRPAHVVGPSIRPLLSNPQSSWDQPAITTYGRGNHSVKTETHRYIRYANGDEELYEVMGDPYEWNNLAADPSSSQIKQQLAGWLPETEQPAKPPLKGKKRGNDD